MDPTKFISGVLCSLSAMVQLELPHINVLTKCDLVDDKELSKYLDPSSGYLLENLANSTDPKWRPLSSAICNVVRHCCVPDVLIVCLRIHLMYRSTISAWLPSSR